MKRFRCNCVHEALIASLPVRLAALAGECAGDMEQTLDHDPGEIVTSVDFNGDGAAASGRRSGARPVSLDRAGQARATA